MTQRDETTRCGHAARAVMFILAFVLTGAAGSASAGWLDSLKDLVSGAEDDQPVLSSEDIGGGLKDALRVGTESVVDRLGASGGFNLDPQIHIPLPDTLRQVKTVLGKVGMDSMLVDLETSLNSAAEIATPRARQLFITAINEMTLDDVMAIYNGPDDAATQYFRSKMSEPLARAMKPIVEESLADVGAATAYGEVMARYDAVPFAPKVDANLGDYVVDKGMDGIFFYLAREESAIREDPAKRTTDLLKRVFGTQATVE